MWKYDVRYDRYRCLFPSERAMEIERTADNRWALYYRRATKPHRSIMVGRFRTVEEAKDEAHELIKQLTRTEAVTSPSDHKEP